MVEQVVAHLVEQLLGVEIEAGLGAVPRGVPEPGDPTLAREPFHRSTLLPVAPQRPESTRGGARGHNGGPCEPPPCSSPSVLLAVGVTACSRDESSSLPRPSKPFCEAAHRYDVRVEKAAPIGEQIQIVQRMADHAPKDIAKDTADLPRRAPAASPRATSRWSTTPRSRRPSTT